MQHARFWCRRPLAYVGDSGSGSARLGVCSSRNRFVHRASRSRRGARTRLRGIAYARVSPWRVLMIARTAAQLVDSIDRDPATPSLIVDTS
jgi:hypothetical protein